MLEAIADTMGKPLAEWQRKALKAISQIDERGQFVHRRVGASIPRQTGKTTITEIWVIFLAMCLGFDVLWTAHSYACIGKTWDDFREIFGLKANDPDNGIPYFNAHVKRISAKTAQEAIMFEPFEGQARAGMIRFATRTKTNSVGSTFDIVVLDEAQEITDEHLQAILPTTSSGAMKNPQYIYTGTPRRPGSAAHVFEDMRKGARNNDDTGDLCWIEYGLSEVGDISDENRWRIANPSLDAGIANIDAIRALKKQMKPLAFAQECLGV